MTSSKMAVTEFTVRYARDTCTCFEITNNKLHHSYSFDVNADMQSAINSTFKAASVDPDGSERTADNTSQFASSTDRYAVMPQDKAGTI